MHMPLEYWFRTEPEAFLPAGSTTQSIFFTLYFENAHQHFLPQYLISGFLPVLYIPIIRACPR
jgi:hypothetical protein